MAELERKIVEENTEEDKKSFGTNELGAYAMFTQRKKYKDISYPKVTVPTPFDLWYDPKKYFFGKVDTNGDPIILRETYLKQIPSPDSQNTWALDFVVDAFNDFKQYYSFLNKRNAEENQFKFLNPQRAWTSMPVSYNSYLDRIFDDFVGNFLANKKRGQQVRDFDSFLKMFLQYVRLSEGKYPFTLSAFALSTFAPPASSGLMIEVTDDSHGNDILKYDDFISNINFECYADTAQQFGFKLDKNYPGRLIADVKSPAMLQYMNQYPKQPEEFTISAPTLNIPPQPQMDDIKSPWMVGDLVEMYVIVPTKPSEDWFILSDFTMPKNQAYPIGQRPRLVRTEDGREIDELQYLQEYFEGYGELVTYTLQITNPMPTNRLQYVVRAGTSERPAEVSEASPVTFSNPVAYANIVDVSGKLKNNLDAAIPGGPDAVTTRFNSITYNQIIGQRNLSIARTGPRSTSLGTNPLRDLTANVENFRPSSSGYYAVQNPTPELNQPRRIITEVPFGALHVKRVDGSEFASERVINFYNPEARQRQFQGQLDAWRTLSGSLVEQYDERKTRYDNLKRRHDVAVADFQTAPRLQFDNFVNSRYNRAYIMDADMMKEMLMQFYYSYSSAKPQIIINERAECGSRNARTKKTIIQREQITKKKVFENYDNTFWLRYYILLRNFERVERFPNQVINRLIVDSYQVMQQKSFQSALKFVNQHFKKSVDHR